MDNCKKVVYLYNFMCFNFTFFMKVKYIKGHYPVQKFTTIREMVDMAADQAGDTEAYKWREGKDDCHKSEQKVGIQADNGDSGGGVRS